VTPQNPDYPTQLEIDYPDRLSRLLPFVKWLLAIPHYLIMYVLGIAAAIGWLLAAIAVLFTGTYPLGLFNFLAGFERWRVRISAYLTLMTDRYPPFSLADDPSYPVRMQVVYPERVARWRPLLNWLLVFPASICMLAIVLLGFVCVFIAFFAILFTARYPRGLFNVVLVGHRWYVRITIFSFGMTAAYPPFVWA
jgi:hypothetical protein